MDISTLRDQSKTLTDHMLKVGYSQVYVKQVEREARWLVGNGKGYDSLDAAIEARLGETRSKSTIHARKGVLGIIREFALRGTLPEFGRRSPIRSRGAIDRLLPSFADVVDRYTRTAEGLGLAESTVAHRASTTASFLLAMQEAGRTSLSEVTQEDVLSRMTGEDGLPAFSATVSGILIAVLTSDLGPHSDEAARVAALIPRPKSSRHNVDFLDEEELEAVRNALADTDNDLTLRDRAIVNTLRLTGMRRSDVAALTFGDIDWDREEIEVVQRKTGEPLSLPLTAAVGNAIFDYVEGERPSSDDPHVFLLRTKSAAPINASTVSVAVRRVLDAAGVRVGDARSHGTHLFRHNAATTMVSSGVPRPVASAVLGHRDPGSLDAYLHADIERLRACALDVSAFGLGKGAFDV